METLGHLMMGFGVAFQPLSLFMMVVGLLLGLAVRAWMGLTPGVGGPQIHSHTLLTGARDRFVEYLAEKRSASAPPGRTRTSLRTFST